MTSSAQLPPYSPERRMLIDGELVEASGGGEFDNINPATEEVLGQVADAAADDMDRAIAAARRAFDETDWSTNRDAARALPACSCRRRSRPRRGAARRARRRGRHAGRGDLHGAAGLAAGRRVPLAGEDDRRVRVGAAAARQHPDRHAVAPRWSGRSRSASSGAIVPWNFPFEITTNKLGPILATGNTVVLKPAPDTPWNATRLGRLIAEKTDIPAGVVNVVTSADHLVGEELTLDPRVDMISFTGSTATGQRIMEKGAATLKRVFLELGGKSAMIVLRRRRLRRRAAQRRAPRACTPGRAARCRPGCCCPGRATTRASRSSPRC